MNPKGGVGVETERSGAEGPMENAERDREQEPRCWTFQSQAERRDRGQTEESWLLFEGIDTFLYDLMRKSKIDSEATNPSERWKTMELVRRDVTTYSLCPPTA